MEYNWSSHWWVLQEQVLNAVLGRLNGTSINRPFYEFSSSRLVPVEDPGIGRWNRAWHPICVRQQTFVELFLSAGISKQLESLCIILLHAVKQKMEDFVSLLIAHGVSPEYRDAECVRIAMKESPEIAYILLQGSINSENASKILDAITADVATLHRFGFIKEVLRFKPGTESLGRALMGAVETKNHELILLLVENGGPMRCEKAVETAALRMDLEFLKILLRPEVGPSTITPIFQALMDLLWTDNVLSQGPNDCTQQWTRTPSFDYAS